MIVYKIAPSGNSKLAGRNIVSVANVAKCWRQKRTDPAVLDGGHDGGDARRMVRPAQPIHTRVYQPPQPSLRPVDNSAGRGNLFLHCHYMFTAC